MTAKKGMTREQAHELYDSLKKAMEAKYGKKGLAALIAADKKHAAASGKGAKPDIADQMRQVADRISISSKARGMGRKTAASGSRTAIAMIFFVGLVKITLSGIEATGVMSAPAAEASLISMQQQAFRGPSYTEEEVGILKSLDERRVALEQRAQKLEEQEEEFERRDREYAARLTQLRELTDRLKLDREKNEKKRNVQMDQLASVYSSMVPNDAADLLEQLDVTIALSLLERMPEKRIGQILALMSPERALAITQMLSRK